MILFILGASPLGFANGPTDVIFSFLQSSRGGCPSSCVYRIRWRPLHL